MFFMTDEIQALVISNVKYGDHALICRCYTQNSGLRSFLLKNQSVKGKASTKSSFFIPLSQIFITPLRQKSACLTIIKEVRSAFFYKSLHTHAPKIALVVFLSEFLSIVLKEDQPDSGLFAYLTESFHFLDEEKKHFADFHLFFILNLARFLGFYPNIDKVDKSYFDLKNGIFTSERLDIKTCLSEKDTFLLKSLIKHNFLTKSPQIHFEKQQRRSVLNILLNYYQLQYINFRVPRSLQVLSEIS